MRTKALCASACLWALPALAQAPARPLTELTPQELSEIEVVSAAKKPETLQRTPAAVTVITREEILRAGATTLADALRLAPGVQVARVDSNRWSVGVRGFPSRLSRALLVLIDGRSVYTTLFAGTYWEVQDTYLPDVERIEVIRGPGGALWGANAVNGVINIITRRSTQTQGTDATVRAGSLERFGAGARHGFRISDTVTASVYAQGASRSALEHQEAQEPYDAWRFAQAGFHLDASSSDRGGFGLQGDVYSGRLGQQTALALYEPPYQRVVRQDADVSGGNLLGRVAYDFGAAGQLLAQGYWDRTTRDEASLAEVRDTFDLSVQHRLRLRAHELVAGVGWRSSQGTTTPLSTVVLYPPDRTDRILNVFLQDEVALGGSVWLVAGAKAERNDYTGWEWQPSGRLLFTPGPSQTFWLAVSRAVRTPSRVERDLDLTSTLDPSLPLYGRLVHNPGFTSEHVTAYELGWRVQPFDGAWLDVTGFWNDYSRLLSIEPGAPQTGGGTPGVVLPFHTANGLEGRGAGFEVAAGWAPRPWWHLAGSWSYLALDLHPGPESHDTIATAQEGDAPRHMGTLRSAWILSPGLRADAVFRAVSALGNQHVPGYAALDVKVSAEIGRHVELSVVGRDLLTARHDEFAGGTAASVAVPRSGFVEAALRW